jgi:hypothetical protein
MKPNALMLINLALSSMISSCSLQKRDPVSTGTNINLNEPLPVGSAPVSISIGRAEPSSIKRTVITWGYNDLNGKFVLGGRGIFDSDGGTLVGHVSPTATKEVEIATSVDYANPVHTDINNVYKCQLRTSGVNIILPYSAFFSSIRIMFRIPKNIGNGDSLVFHWKYDPDDDSQSGSRQQGTIQLTSSTLTSNQLIARTISFPIRDFKAGSFVWAMSGIFHGRPLSPVDVAGRMGSTGSLIVDLTQGNNKFSFSSASLPEESTIGNIRRSYSPCS